MYVRSNFDDYLSWHYMSLSTSEGDARGKQTNHEAEVNHACNDSTCTSSNSTNSDVCMSSVSSVYSASIDAAKKNIVIDSSIEVSDSSSSSSVVCIRHTVISRYSPLIDRSRARKRKEQTDCRRKREKGEFE